MFRQLSIGVALVGAIGCGSSRVAVTTPRQAALDAVLVSRPPEFQDVTVASGTTLLLTLESTVASNVNHAEDPVQARLSQPLVIGDMEVIPRGSPIEGTVSDAQRSGTVEERARLAVKFHTLVIHDRPYNITTANLARVTPGAKDQHARESGIPAAGGAQTAYLLATPGKEVRLRSGERLAVRLDRAVTIRVPVEGI